MHKYLVIQFTDYMNFLHDAYKLESINLDLTYSGAWMKSWVFFVIKHIKSFETDGVYLVHVDPTLSALESLATHFVFSFFEVFALHFG